MNIYETILKSIEQELNKCSDGTYLSKPLVKSLNNFAETYRDTKIEHLGMYNYNGQELFEVEEGTWKSVKVPIFKLASLNLNNIHLTHNHPVPMYDGLVTMLSKRDCYLLLEQNFRGEFMIRSISAESKGDGSKHDYYKDSSGRITLIRNNNFTDADKNKFYRATSKMRKVYDKYKDEFYVTVNREEIRIFQERMGRNPTTEDMIEGRFNKEAVNKGIEKMGSLEDRFREEGVYDALDNCNCTLKMG